MQRRHERNIRKDIEHQQSSAKLVIPFTSFSRLVHELLADQGDFCIRFDAVQALQTAAEDRVTEMFVDANKLAVYSGRETVSGRDLQFTLPSDECRTTDDDDMEEEHCAHQQPVTDL